MVLTLLTLTLATGRQAFGQCITPSDTTTVISTGGGTNCGNTSWELKVRFGPDIYDEGEYDATGACTGGFTNRQCEHTTANFKQPSKSFILEQTYSNPEENTYDWAWYWTITFYDQPEVTSCASGPCQGEGYFSEADPTEVDDNSGYDTGEAVCSF